VYAASHSRHAAKLPVALVQASYVIVSFTHTSNGAVGAPDPSGAAVGREGGGVDGTGTGAGTAVDDGDVDGHAWKQSAPQMHVWYLSMPGRHGPHSPAHPASVPQMRAVISGHVGSGSAPTTASRYEPWHSLQARSSRPLLARHCAKVWISDWHRIVGVGAAVGACPLHRVRDESENKTKTTTTRKRGALRAEEGTVRPVIMVIRWRRRKVKFKTCEKNDEGCMKD
jgi:hypothetical protein